MSEKERLKEIEKIKEIEKDKALNGDDVVINKEHYEWLMNRAKQVQRLEKRVMQLIRAMKHIAQYPTHCSHEIHSLRAQKISRKILAKIKREDSK